jgi:hypothetical protein
LAKKAKCLPSYINIAHIPSLEASHSIRNGFEKSSNPNTKGVSMSSLSLLKALVAFSFQQKDSFLIQAVKGATMPPYPLKALEVLGVGQFN